MKSTFADDDTAVKTAESTGIHIMVQQNTGFYPTGMTTHIKPQLWPNEQL